MTVLSKKVCLLGDFAVGKTSLVRRFVYNRFDDRYLSTIGVKVSRKTVVVPREDDVVELNILLWDLAGGEEFSQVQASYLRGAAGGVLVCDRTRPETLRALATYVEDLRVVSPDARIILAANKSDLADDLEKRRGPWLGASEIAEVAAQLDAPFYLTSALSGDLVEEIFRRLGRLLVA